MSVLAVMVNQCCLSTLAIFATWNIKDSYYGCIIILIIKNEAIKVMQNAGLAKKAENYRMYLYV